MARASSAKKAVKKPSKKVSVKAKKVPANAEILQGFGKSFGKAKKLEIVPPKGLEPATEGYAEQPIESSFAEMSERLLRIQRDLMTPSLIFERAKIQNTITVFGSAQIRPEEAAKKALEEVKKSLARVKKPSIAQKEKLEKARMAVKMSKYYTATEDLTRRLQEWSNCLPVAPDDKFYIMTGGGPGIMEAANKGAYMAGGKTAGLTIFIPDEQRRNDFVAPDAWFNFNYFLMRKFWLLFFAKALVVMPGGTGTFDEFFEVFTLMKTRKTKNYIPTVLFGREFWEGVINFKYFLKTGVIGESDLEFFTFADTVDEAYNHITSELTRLYF